MPQQPGSDPATTDGPRAGAQRAPAPAPAPQSPSPAPRRARSRLSFFAPRAGSSVDPLLAPLLETMTAVSPKENLEIVRRAYTVAERAHRGQTRKSGDRTSPIPSRSPRSWPSSARPAEVVAAALLHDTVEDTDYSPGTACAPSSAGDRRDGRRRHQAGQGHLWRGRPGRETVRKMIVAMSRDVRVLLIKLPTVCTTPAPGSTSAASAERKAKETLEIYAAGASTGV